ncbi:hypothetical protein, partial [Atlantibacter hermannii]|uniref:hypothetical protein n=1 Tax=Atlantibacter hermannii TaxID=565 RepID=UPI002FD93DAB
FWGDIFRPSPASFSCHILLHFCYLSANFASIRHFLRKTHTAPSPYLMGNCAGSRAAKIMPQANSGLSQILSMIGYGRLIIFTGKYIDVNK